MSTKRNQGMMWGVFLIYLGLILGLRTLEVVSESSGLVWAALFAGAAVIGFVAYLVGDRKVWPLLFPAVVSTGIAAVLFVEESGVFDGGAGDWVGGLFLIIISLPFWLAIFVGGRQQWWALIPAWVLAAIGLSLVFINENSELFPSVILLAIGLPFLLVFLYNRQNWWALIPAGVLIAISAALALSTLGSGEWLAPAILAGISLPFWFLAFWRPEMWWAIIPAGVLVSVSALTVVAMAGGDNGRWAVATMFLGISLTFGLLWLRRKRLAAAGHDTRWAIYPAAITLLVGLFIPLVGQSMELFWGGLLVAAGVFMLLRTMFGRGGDQKPGKAVE